MRELLPIVILIIFLLSTTGLAQESVELAPQSVNFHEFTVKPGQTYIFEVRPDGEIDVTVASRTQAGQVLLTDYESKGIPELVQLRAVESTIQIFVGDKDAGAGSYTIEAKGATQSQTYPLTREQFEPLLRDNQVFQTPRVTAHTSQVAPKASLMKLAPSVVGTRIEPERFRLTEDAINIHTFKVTPNEPFTVTVAGQKDFGLVLEQLEPNMRSLVEGTTPRMRQLYALSPVETVQVAVRSSSGIAGEYALITVGAKSVRNETSRYSEAEETFLSDRETTKLPAVPRGPGGGSGGGTFELKPGQSDIFTLAVEPGKQYDFAVSSDIEDLLLFAFPIGVQSPGFLGNSKDAKGQVTVPVTPVKSEVVLIVSSPSGGQGSYYLSAPGTKQTKLDRQPQQGVTKLLTPLTIYPGQYTNLYSD